MKPTLILSYILAFALTLTSSFSFALQNVVFKNDTSHEAKVTILYSGCPKDEITVAAGKEGKVLRGRGNCLITGITVPGAVPYANSGTSYHTFGLVMNPATGLEQVRMNVTASNLANAGTTASSDVKQQLMKCLGNKAVPEGKESLYQSLSAAGRKQ